MIEIIENAAQVLVTGVCLVLSFVRFFRQRDEAWTCLCAFYGCTFFAICYWLGYLIVFGSTPRFFYVSEMGWAASYLLILVLVATLDGQRAPEPPVAAAWIPIIIVIPQFVLYITHGDIVLNVIDCSLMAAIGFFTVRGILTPYKEGLAGNRAFHVSVFIWGLLQLAVWTASCFSTPVFSMLYTVSDFLLTASYAGILVCAWRVRP